MREIVLDARASMGLPTVIGRGEDLALDEEAPAVLASMGLPTVIGRGGGDVCYADLTDLELQWGCRR